MQRRTIHQWRDWLLEYIGGDKYELIQKNTHEVFTIVAKDSMDAEIKSRHLIENTKEEKV